MTVPLELTAVVPPPELPAAAVPLLELPAAVVPPAELLLLLHAAATSTAAIGSVIRTALDSTE
jgi:hypothetical protein